VREAVRQALLIARKDLRIFVSDRGALLFALIFPFAFVAIFSTVMGNPAGVTDQPFTVCVATAESDEAAVIGEADAGGGTTARGSLSRLIIDALTSDDVGLDVREADPDKARAALEKEEVGGYLLFPEDFTAKVLAGEPATLTVYCRPDVGRTRAALNSIAQAIATDITAYQVTYRAFHELAGERLPPGALEALGGSGPAGPGSGEVGSGLAGQVAVGSAAGLLPPPAERPEVSLVYEKVGEVDPVSAADILIPGYLTMFVFFAMALTAETIVGEKESYTLERLTAAGASRLAVVGGKYLGSFGRALIQVAAFWSAGVLIFHVDMGRYPATVVWVSVLMALASSGVGVFLATLAKSRKGAAAMGVFVSLSAAAFGGSMWPLFVMPQWLQTAARITPHAWANSAFNKLMLFGATPADVAGEMVALAAFGLLFMALGVWRFRVE